MRHGKDNRMKYTDSSSGMTHAAENPDTAPVSREAALIALVLATAVIIVMVNAAQALVSAGWLNSF